MGDECQFCGDKVRDETAYPADDDVRVNVVPLQAFSARGKRLVESLERRKS